MEGDGRHVVRLSVEAVEYAKPPCNARRQTFETMDYSGLIRLQRNGGGFLRTLLLLARQGSVELDRQFAQTLGHRLGGDRVYETPRGSLQSGEVVALWRLSTAGVIGESVVRTHDGSHHRRTV